MDFIEYFPFKLVLFCRHVLVGSTMVTNHPTSEDKRPECVFYHRQRYFFAIRECHQFYSIQS